MLGHLDGEARRGSRLANAALASDKDPLQGVLIDNILKGRSKFGLLGCLNHDLFLFLNTN